MIKDYRKRTYERGIMEGKKAERERILKVIDDEICVYVDNFGYKRDIKELKQKIKNQTHEQVGKEDKQKS